ncbi:MAG: glycosyltransferase family 4 protein [Deltaproteobacteria bacterium]|nr:glycosyltransferase family 4 protein [Deltaproteobacteria bacterium]
MSLKIILLASGDLYGGAEAVVYNLVKGLKAYPSINLCVVLFNNGRLADLCMEQEVETIIIDEAKYNFFRLAWKLVHITKSFRPDIIHSHRYKENILALIVKIFAPRSRLITTVHGLSEGHPEFKTKLLSKINLYIEKYIFNKIVAVSDDIKNYFVNKLNFPESKVARVYNGIEMPEINKSHDNNKKTFTIGSAGRFFPVKDYFLMVDIAKELCAARDDIIFVLAGEGPMKTAIEEKIKKYKIEDKFRLPGNLDNMQNFYNSIDLYLNTSHHEGIPITIIEAMSNSIPVVAPAVGGLPEIVENGKTGRLVKKRTAAEFARIIDNIIPDNDAMAVAGKNSRERAEKYFSIVCMSESYMNIYMDLARKV